MSSDPRANKNKSRARRAPASSLKDLAVVQCEGYRCLAYRDANIWRDLDTGKELTRVQGIVEWFNG